MATYPFRTALVTGASSGIGEAIAGELAADGVHVIAVARRRDRLDALADRWPGLVQPLTVDLTSSKGCAEAVAILRDHCPDLVVNNAGFGTSGSFAGLDPDRLDREIALNVGALTRLSREALGPMTARGRGWLLNVSSVVSFQPAPRLAVYAATKAYVTSLSESLHEEVRGTGVHVTALCPGLTRTEFQSISSSAEYASAYPDQLWMEPAEVARTGLRDCARGKTLSVPGSKYKVMVAASDVLPRGVMRRAASIATDLRDRRRR